MRITTFHIINIVAIFMIAIMFTGCKSVNIDKPLEESVHVDPPDIELSFPGGVPDTLKIYLNDTEITDYLIIEANAAIIPASRIESILIDGKNYLAVESPITPIRTFYYDRSGPEVHITSVDYSDGYDIDRIVSQIVKDFPDLSDLGEYGEYRDRATAAMVREMVELIVDYNNSDREITASSFDDIEDRYDDQYGISFKDEFAERVISQTVANSVMVSGYVADPSGIEFASIGGEMLELDANNRFSQYIEIGWPSSNCEYLNVWQSCAPLQMSVESRDRNGYVTSYSIVDPLNTLLTVNSVQLLISQSGFNFLAEEIENLIKELPFGEFEYEEDFDEGPLSGGVEVDDFALDDADIRIELAPQSKGPDISVSIESVSVDASASLEMEISSPASWLFDDQEVGFDLSMTINVSDVEVESYVPITANGDGKFEVEFEDFDIDIGDIYIDIQSSPGMWDDFISDVEDIADLFKIDIPDPRDEVVSALANFSQQFFIGAIEDAVTKIAEEKINEFIDSIPDYYVNIDGNKLNPELGFAYFVTLDNGFNIKLGSLVRNLTFNGPTQLGYRREQHPDIGINEPVTTSAPGDKPRDIGMSIDQNILNLVLSEATEAGLLNYSVILPTTFGLPVDDNPEDGQIRASLIPTSSPYIDILSPNEDGFAELSFQDLGFNIEILHPGESEFELYLESVVDIKVAADLGINSDNAIAVDISGIPEVLVRKINFTGQSLGEEDENSASFAWGKVLIQDLLDNFVPLFMRNHFNKIGAVALPQFEGYGVNVGDLWVIDEQGHYVGLTLDIIRRSTMENAPAPQTFAELVNPVHGLAGTGGRATISGDKVTIKASGYNPSNEPLQYRYALDEYGFGLWQLDNEITLYGLQPGPHSVKVCSRTELLVEDKSCSVIKFETY